MHWQKASGLEGKQDCKSQLKRSESYYATDKLHVKLWSENRNVNSNFAHSAKGFLRNWQVFAWNFGLQIMPDPAPATTPETFPRTHMPVGQGHQSQVPFQVGSGQAQIWLSLKRCKGAYLMPSRPASCYRFDHWDTATFGICPQAKQPQTNPSPLSTPPLIPDPHWWQLLNYCMGKAWHKGVPGQVTWTSDSATYQDIPSGYCWKPEGKANRKAMT